jgi:hypothetical protein
VAPDDVGLAGDPDLRVSVSAVTTRQSRQPWDWSGAPLEELAVVRAYGPTPPAPDENSGGAGGANEPGAPGGANEAGGAAEAPGAGGAADGAGSESGGAGPKFSTNVLPNEGIYSLDGATLNPGSCDAGGASVLADETERLFYLIYVGDTLRVASCSDADACREAAQDSRELDIVPSSNWEF